MAIGSYFAVYLLFWSVTLFAVLPFGVRTVEEAGVEAGRGHAESAPHRIDWRAKLGWTTAISAALFGVWLANDRFEWIVVEDLLPAKANQQ